MEKIKMKRIFHQLILLILLSLPTFAITAIEIAQNAYNVNHSLYFKNIMIKKQNRAMVTVIGRMPNKTPRITRIERFLSTEFKEKHIESKDLVIIRSGKLKGLGVLMTAYTDATKSHEYLMWLPALRKVRRMAEPKDAGMGAGDIAFLEDAKLRRFDEEDYELLETKTMDLALKMMPFKKGEFGTITNTLPFKEITNINNKKIHIIKSTYKNKEKSHWYDYRISYIDAQSFTNYLSHYYKNDKPIKNVYRHWIPLKGQTDPKAKIWYYWYSKDMDTGYEMMTYIPQKLIKVNEKVKRSFWSERTLQKIKR
ncbi:MAG: Unknown protein [uncultured Sulfurovum sp.]|uniref:Outer membrane lipoprotein-sorting protein n=1 Tax=uncultured Sulfurovum sp. TaxID=269237 RepID=A0A6S6SQD9_9BACT|nr:MAG: Unknown protein [uncultured Sulfurovum sp.]